ncbi:MAG: HD domain-containing protein [Pseudomonadota bacterium]
MLALNIGKIEGQFRILLAIVLIVVGTHSYWVLFVFGLLLLLTGLKHYCPVYSVFNINTKIQQSNYLLSQLPRYNPEPVFIFNNKGEKKFSNDAAQRILPSLNNISEIVDQSEFNIDEIIEKKLNFSSEYQHQHKTFAISFQGARGIQSIVAYAFDITDIVKADQEIIDTQKEIVYTMGEISEQRSKETGNHVRRVAEYSELLALKYGLDTEQAALLKMASPMHDIGKVAIPDAILNKPGCLNKDEFEIMKTHAQLGYEMLNHSQRPILKAAAIVACEHHEKYDGTGYPRGLKGQDIHIFGRITAIADVFDALGSDRVYKKAWGDKQIFELFKQQRGVHFDPQLMDLFFTYLDDFLIIRSKYHEH